MQIHANIEARGSRSPRLGYRDLTEATIHIGSFLEQVCNRQRLHSALAYQAPEAYEATDPARLPDLTAVLDQ